MENNTDFFGGFESITGALTSKTSGMRTQEDIENDHIETVDPEDLEDLDEEDTQEDAIIDEEDEIVNPEGEEDEEETSTGGGSKDDKFSSKKEPLDGGSDLGEAEPEIAQYVQDKLAEELGWEFEDSEKFKSVKDVVAFLKEVVDANSVPQYANEEIGKLNDFVANGGKIEDYIKTTKGEVDIETIDLSNENNQKSVIRELLKEKGYSESRINRSIDRYVDAGVLEDEAEDAVELLKEIREEKSEKLLKDQEKQKEVLEQQKQKYIEDVELTVNTLESVRGIPISDKEKKQLMDYIFKPTADGRTKYQKDYVSNVKNLIESAYFTMKGDTFIQKVQRKANSDAAINLKKKLSSTSKQRSTPSGGNSAWGLLSSQLRKPNK